MYGTSNNGDPKDGRGQYAQKGKLSLESMGRKEGPGMSLNPAWVEALMGFPEGWTDGLQGEGRPKKSGSPRERS